MADAFASFTQTAGALETTYTNLQTEVSRLRRELEDKNRTLAKSWEENQRMRTYLGRIMEELPCGVLVFDAQNNLRIINPAADRLLNEDSENAPGPNPLSRLLGSWLATNRAEESGQEQEWVVEGWRGQRTLGVTRAWLRGQGAGDDSILILRDLTEAKQLEREREQARRSQALAEVTTLLAHEIRNPLGSLELFAGLLADALSQQPELHDWINHVQAGLRSLAATVNNVLQFHSQPPAQLLPVDLIRLLGETVDFLHPLARQKELQIDGPSKQSPLFILADSNRLQQAFFNLALNAFRAMQPGGRLAISVAPDADAERPLLAVAFKDDGTGIRGEQLGRIFEPGFSTQSGSPGLGLAVTRKIIEQHGGGIRVESQEGKGTIFTLTFPCLDAEAMG